MSAITIATVTIPNFRFTASAVYLRLYVKDAFVSSSGVPIQAGNPDINGSWYKQVTCTLAGTDLTIPAITDIESTTDGADTVWSAYNAFFYDGNGRQLGQYAGFEEFRLSTLTPTTWQLIRSFNFTRASTWDNSVYTKQQVDNLLANFTSGAPTSAPFLTTTVSASLTGASNLGLLTTGLLKISVSGAVATPSTAVAGTDYQTPLVAGTDYLAPSGNGSLLTALNATQLASGTVPAARFPALTGDVTTSVGAVATTIANDAVTFAKFQNITTARLLGRGTASSGDVEEITVSAGTSGTDFAIAYGAGTLALNLPDAGAAARGVVTTGTQTFAGAKTLSAKLTTLATGQSIEALENALSSAMLSTSNEGDYGGIGFQRGAAGIAAATGTPFLNIQIHQRPNASIGQTVLNYAFFSSRHGSGASATANGGAEAVYNLAGIIESDATATTLSSMHDIVGIVGLAIGRSGSSARSYGAHFDARLETTSGAAIGAESVVRNTAGTAPTIQSGTEAGRTVGFNIVGRATGSGSKNTVGLLFQSGDGATSAFKTGIYFEANTVDASGYAMDFLPLGIIPAMRFANAQPIVGRNAAGSADVVLFSIDGSDQLSFAATGNASVFGGSIASTYSNTDTATVATQLTLAHTTTNTAAAGFGNSILYQLEAGSGTLRNASRIATYWTDATDATPDSAVSVETAVDNVLTTTATFDYKTGATFTSIGTPVIYTRVLAAASGLQGAAQFGLSGFNGVAADGTSMLFFLPNGSGTKSFVGRVSGVWEVPTAGSETGCVTVNVRASTGDTTAATEAARFTSASNLKIGGAATRGTTEGTKHLDIFDGTAPVGTLTNGISLYSASGECRVMDAAGNSTLLSPHDRVTNEWIYDSVDTRTGKHLRIDVERLMRFVNAHFGTDFVHDFAA
jgi:hypothetical protein